MPKISRNRCQECAARCKSSFANLPDVDLQEINRLRSTVEFKEGSKLPLNFDGEEGFYCVQAGHLKINLSHGDSTGTLRICGPGDLIGFNHQPSHLSIEALESGVGCFLPKKAFAKLQSQSSAVANGMIKMLCSIISAKDHNILGLERQSVKNRVSSLLLGLNDKFGTPSKQGSKIDVKIDRDTLAKMA